ncbi:MAG: hypothetical protein CMJ45_14115 [Planctomyces sp.]|jgi:ethanolamine utilization microcompartment shell protein EutS|nr:hypothetical protein [Planctomyces sp.]
MKFLFVLSLALIAAVIGAFNLLTGTASAHEQREVGRYELVVGFIVEPAFEGLKNGLDLRVTKKGMKEGAMAMEMAMDTAEHGAVFGSPALAPGETFTFEVEHDLEDMTIPYHSHENHDIKGSITVSHDAELSGMVEITINDAMVMPADITVKPGTMLMWTNRASGAQTATSGLPPMEGHTHEPEEVDVPLEGLEETLKWEITHVASGATRTLDLRTIFRDPGHYTADLIPTAPGIYEFRIFGTVEGVEVNELFISRGGGGGFGDVESSGDLQFPETLPEVREIEGAVRGVQTTAEQAQDAALSAGENASSANTLAIVGIILGVVGIVSGAGGAVLGMRKR